MQQWDALPETERDLWVADWQEQQTTCPHCGNRLSECSDPNRLWYPYRRICYATMEREAATAAYAALHKDRPYHDGTFTSWSDTRDAGHPYEAMSGVFVMVTDRDLAPDDRFTTRESAVPSPAPGIPPLDASGDAGDELDNAADEGDDAADDGKRDRVGRQ